MNLKRILCCSLVLMLFIAFTHAKPRTSTEALAVANQFYINKLNGAKSIAPNSQLKLAYACTGTIVTRSVTNAYYYIFNKADNKGYIIVSGDDLARDILGYTDSGNFQFESIPINFKNWLMSYQRQLEYLSKHPEEFASSTSVQESRISGTKSANLATSVAPLLGRIQWNQDSPYNNLCPIINASTGERAATGCVATAMAQVMRYYKWPARGAGSNQYTYSNNTLYLDFSQTVFDWNNMTETYSATSTIAQNDAVATLMYNCGVAVKMSYGPSSSAYSNDMALALINNFGYDPKLQYANRNYYTKTEWQDLLKTDLDALRPILYGGNSDSGGHQFVCDGYDTNNLFHINWGWGGQADGYFEISALNPESVGIGGGNGGGFNYNQDMVYGVQIVGGPTIPASYAIQTHVPFTVGVTTTGRNNGFTATMNEVYNDGINSFSGNWNFALYDNNGFVSLIGTNKSIQLPGDRGYASSSFTVTIPSSVANGIYKIYPVYKANDQADWHVMRAPTRIANYMTVNVSSSTVSFTTPSTAPQLSLNTLTTTGNVYENKEGRFTFSITNTGTDFNSNITLRLESTTDPTKIQVIDKGPYVIGNGETKSATIVSNVTVAPGQYKLYVYYDSANNLAVPGTDVVLGTPLSLTVMPTPTANFTLTATTRAYFPDPLHVNRNNIILNTRLLNSGGFFDKNLCVFILKTTSGASIGNFGYHQELLDTNEEREIVFTGSSTLAAGDYYAVVTYYSGTAWTILGPTQNNVIPFTLVDDNTAINSSTIDNIAVSPNSASGVVYVKASEVIRSISIYNISGSVVYTTSPNENGEISIPISQLSKGIYLIRVETLNGNKVCKFLKE